MIAFFSKCDQIRMKPRICLHSQEKSLMGKVSSFVQCLFQTNYIYIYIYIYIYVYVYIKDIQIYIISMNTEFFKAHL